MSERINDDVAGRLDEVGRLLASQGADPLRVRAYRRAAEVTRALKQPVSEILEEQGLEGLKALPGVGESIARAIRNVVSHGRMAMLERLRGESDPVKILASVPGIGRGLADRLHHDFGTDSLDDLEAAAHDGCTVSPPSAVRPQVSASYAVARTNSYSAAGRLSVITGTTQHRFWRQT